MPEFRIVEHEDFIEVDGHRIYVDNELRKPLLQSPDALAQFSEMQKIPGLIGAVGLPDMHSGYFFPVGSVAAVDLSNPDACISPEGVGYDINCGVRCLRSNLKLSDLAGHAEELADTISGAVPAGMGMSGAPAVALSYINGILESGMKYLYEQGEVPLDDLIYTESGGSLEGSSRAVYQKAKSRGLVQLGSLGSGNHYLEVQVVEEIFDAATAEVLGLEEGQILVSIHTGSRGLGHVVCNAFMEEVKKERANGAKYKTHRSIAKCSSAGASSDGEKDANGTAKEARINMAGAAAGALNNSMDATKNSRNRKDLLRADEGDADETVNYVPYHSLLGQKYMLLMNSASNFAWANRAAITRHVRQAFAALLPQSRLDVLCDVCHNIAKLEAFGADGARKVLVHRKGASRVLPPGHKDLSDRDRDIGQPVLVGGSMGTCSYLVVGGKLAEETFNSTCHGAGRLLSRSEARAAFAYEDVAADMRKKGIVFRCEAREGMVEEACGCYKDVTRVVEHSAKVGLTRTVARVRPVIVIKG